MLANGNRNFVISAPARAALTFSNNQNKQTTAVCFAFDVVGCRVGKMRLENQLEGFISLEMHRKREREGEMKSSYDDGISANKCW